MDRRSVGRRAGREARRLGGSPREEDSQALQGRGRGEYGLSPLPPDLGTDQSGSNVECVTIPFVGVDPFQFQRLLPGDRPGLCVGGVRIHLPAEEVINLLISGS